jgi:hypothetical protein
LTDNSPARERTTTILIAEDDDALRGLLLSRGWRLERIERGALQRGEKRVHVGVYALFVGQLAPLDPRDAVS